MEQGFVKINNQVFTVLIAISEPEQARGLMRVEPPVPNMAFVYGSPKVTKFWMANTPAPLDIVFCHNGQVTQICQGEPYSTKLIGDDMVSDLVIEFPRGAAVHMKPGDKVGLLKPTIDELRKIIAEKYHKFVKF
jgi:uncharacterized membrane protein (UPF0127 family)